MKWLTSDIMGWQHEGVDVEELQSSESFLQKTEGSDDASYPTPWWSWILTGDIAFCIKYKFPFINISKLH